MYCISATGGSIQVQGKQYVAGHRLAWSRPLQTPVFGLRFEYTQQMAGFSQLIANQKRLQKRRHQLNYLFTLQVTDAEEDTCAIPTWTEIY